MTLTHIHDFDTCTKILRLYGVNDTNIFNDIVTSTIYKRSMVGITLIPECVDNNCTRAGTGQ